jgi:hypothetical protein
VHGHRIRRAGHGPEVAPILLLVDVLRFVHLEQKIRRCTHHVGIRHWAGETERAGRRHAALAERLRRGQFQEPGSPAGAV